MEKTFVIIKPDSVQAGLVGEILSRYERAGLRIEALELRKIDGDFADLHYSEHLDKAYYAPLREFMTEGPLVALVLSGAGAIEKVRAINGATDPAKAAGGTIRAAHGESVRRNSVHASDSPETAAAEIELWFPAS